MSNKIEVRCDIFSLLTVTAAVKYTIPKKCSSHFDTRTRLVRFLSWFSTP